MTYIIKICQDHHRNRFFLARDIFQANHDHSYHPQSNHSNHMWSEKLFCLNLYRRFYTISSYKLTSHVSCPHLCLFGWYWKFLDSMHLFNCFNLSNETIIKPKVSKIRITCMIIKFRDDHLKRFQQRFLLNKLILVNNRWCALKICRSD